jgi:hypothetical protein
MKSFAVFLAELNGGQPVAGLTGDLAELLQAVQATGRSGSLTIKIKVQPGSKPGQHVDKVSVTAERKLELPKPEAPSDFFWLTDDAEPTRQHPRQHALELREPESAASIPAGGAGALKSVNPDTGEITFKEVNKQ